MAEYTFRDGARFQKGARSGNEVAQVVGEHLEIVRQQNEGRLEPEGVVAEAVNPNSPLHAYFEWDDTEAAQQYRLSQARNLIRAVVVRYRETPEGGPKTTRAFVSVTKEDRRSYVPVTTAMSDAEMRAQVIRKAWGEMQAFKARYRHLQEFGLLFASLEELEQALPPVLESAA